jgi:hypothetical protein
VTQISQSVGAAGATNVSDLQVGGGTQGGGTTGPGTGGSPIQTATSVANLGGYRDYLRTIFTGESSSNTYAANLGLLQSRFHQSFVTYDEVERPANEILTEIVKTIVTAPNGSGYGFAIPAGSVAPKGTKTHREYLDYLVGLSQLSAEEFGRRYRLDLRRTDATCSSALAENVATLQRFFADGFQDHEEPSTVVPTGLHGRAPFFLYFEEWLSNQRPFFPENVYRPALTFWGAVELSRRESVKSVAGWLATLCDIEDGLLSAVSRVEQGEFGLARDQLLSVDAEARKQLDPDGQPWWGGVTEAAVSARIEDLQELKVETPDELEHFVWYYRVRPAYGEQPSWTSPAPELPTWLEDEGPQLYSSLVHLVTAVIPGYLGDCALGVGDYAAAIEYYGQGSHMLLARGSRASEAGYSSESLNLPSAIGDPSRVADWESRFEKEPYDSDPGAFYLTDGLPYTVDLGQPRAPDPVLWSYGFSPTTLMFASAMHPFEERFFRLRQGQAMLDWADALYRSDEGPSIQRARELYKSVLWLHGSAPPSDPTWGHTPQSLENANPAVTGQTSRARLGIEQIEAGLNWYGSGDDLVPALRYKAQKDAADRYAAAARSAQQDFLLSTGKLEDSIREGLVNANMLKKASLQERIAHEQVGIAEYAVVMAEQQVEAVKSQIAAKKQEIEDHASLLGQFGDLIDGFSSVVGTVPDGVKDKVGTGVEAGTGLTSTEASGMSAAAGGAAVVGAMAAFVVIGVMTLSSMSDEQLARERQLAALKEKALPLAQAGVAAKQREVTIAQYQQAIAGADIQLATMLTQFQRTRLLNETLWSEMATVMRRVMRRYLDLGGRYGWLAERALAYEQDRPLNIIRFDYFPGKLQGVTGADLLQADLGELDAARLDGIKQTVPVKRTHSMLADCPLQFAQLKETGRCFFQTSEEPFRFAYPGTYGYRIRAVTVTPRSYSGIELPRGLLSNLGVSVVSREDGSSHVLLRPPDALPISEFRLADDMTLYGLPDEALLAFEGSGVETFWELTLPALANRLSLDGLADIELTFDVRARYSPQLRVSHMKSAPKSVRRLVFFSARAFASAGLDVLRDKMKLSATVDFDVPSIGRLPRQESNRKLRNVVLMLPGVSMDFLGSFGGKSSPTKFNVPFVGGLAHSTAAPFTKTPPSPLDVLVGMPVDTTFRLKIQKGLDGDAFAKAEDVLLGIEYSADLT